MTNLSNIGEVLGGFFGGGGPDYIGMGELETGIPRPVAPIIPFDQTTSPEIPAVSSPTMTIPTVEQVSAKEAASAETDRQRKRRGFSQTIVNPGGAGGLGSSAPGLKQTLG